MSTPLIHARPGDIISALTWNSVIDTLNDALLRLDALEGGGGGTGTGLSISQLLPPGPYRIGDTLQVFGQNFQFAAGATRVFFNATQVFDILLSSSDTRLEFAIPPVPGISEAGTLVDLVVMNQSQSVTRQVTLRPAVVPLQGTVLVNFLGVEPPNAPAGATVTFRYRIESRVNARASFAIEPSVEVAANAAAWNAALRVLDAFDTEIPSRQIVDLDAGAVRNFGIRLAPLPAGTSGTAFNIAVSASSAGITGLSGAQPFVVGAQGPQPDPTFTMALNSDFSAGSLVGSTLTVPASQSRQVAIDLALTTAGDYTITRSLSAGSSGWTVNNFVGTTDAFTVTAAELVATGSTTRRLRYSVLAGAAATATGVQTQFSVQRVGQTTQNRLNLNLVRG